jgi:hypothetical protein
MKTAEYTGNKCLDVISNENCSLIVFYHTKEISGMLQLQKIRFSLSFEQYQFANLLAICENKIETAGQYKIFKHPDEFYPIILQISNDIRLFLSEKEWQDVCHVIIQTKTKYYSPAVTA